MTKKQLIEEAKIKMLAEANNDSIDIAQCNADDILTELLTALGCGEVFEIYKKIHSLYA